MERVAIFVFGCIAALLAVMVAAVFALVLLGLLSLVVAKSGKALVPNEPTGEALAQSIYWSGAIATGCMIGSIGLAITMSFFYGDDFALLMQRKYAFDRSHGITASFLYDWLISDSYMFFVKVAIAIFLANRIHVARERGGSQWLQVIPPAVAAVLFFCFDNADLVIRFLVRWNIIDGQEIVARAAEDIWLPLKLMAKTITEPAYVLDWGRKSLMSSDGSIFRLGKYFPSLFCVVALGLSARALFENKPIDVS